MYGSRSLTPTNFTGLALPRRGNGITSAFTPGRGAEQWVREATRLLTDDLLGHLDHPVHDAALAAAAAASLTGGEGGPRGEAAKLMMLEACAEQRWRGRLPALPEKRDLFGLLALRQGLPFAVATVIESLGIELTARPDGAPREPWRLPAIRHAAQPASSWTAWRIRTDGIRAVRGLLSTCADAAYDAVVARAAHHRDTPVRRLAAAYLLPDRTEWVEAAVEAKTGLDGGVRAETVLLALASTPAHLDAAGWGGFTRAPLRPASVAELVVNFGEASLPYLIRALEALPDLDVGDCALLTAGIEAVDTASAHAYLHSRDARHTPLAAAAALPEARREDLPRLLTAPPWTRRRGRPLILQGFEPQDTIELRFSATELARWTAPEAPYHGWPEEALWPRVRQMVERHSVPADHVELVGGLLVRRGAEVADAVVSAALRSPILWPVLVPIGGLGAARVAADWLVRLRHGHRTARAWFDRHGRRAAEILVPDAVGPLGPRRNNAEAALVHLANAIGAEAVEAAGERYGPQAAAAVRAQLEAAVDGWSAPAPPRSAWCDPAALPPLLTADRRSRLGPRAVEHAVTAMRTWSPWNRHPGAAVLAAFCDEYALARCSWALLDQWWSAGRPGRDSWAMHQFVRFGGPEAPRRLAALVERSAWPGAYAQCAEALTALAATGDDAALATVDRYSDLGFGTAVKRTAARLIEAAAERRGLDAEGLRDRIRTPPGSGSELDSYTAGESGRLREAMCSARTWSGEAFRRYLVDRPVRGSLVRRLLWAAEADGAVRAFRVAEDGGFADVDDDPFDLPGDARIRLAHPVLLGGDLAKWIDLFLDYEIVQPFDQLGEAPTTLTAEEAASGRLARFEGVEYQAALLTDLMEYDSRPSMGDGGGRRPMLWRRLPTGCLLAQPDRPIVTAAGAAQAPTATVVLRSVVLQRTMNQHPEHREPLCGDQIDPVVAATVLNALTDARARP